MNPNIIETRAILKIYPSGAWIEYNVRVWSGEKDKGANSLNFLLGHSIFPNLRKWQKSWTMSTLGWFISITVYLEAWYFIWNMSALLLCQIKPLCHFQNSPKKVRRSRPRKRERSTRRSTWESGVRRCAISWSSPSISSHININHLILITVNVFIISSSLAVMTMTVKKTEKRQQKFFTNQVGSLKPQSRWTWSTKKDYENVVLALIIR